MIATILIMGILAIIFGIIVLIWPKILNVIVAIWLLIWGILQVLNGLGILTITGFAVLG